MTKICFLADANSIHTRKWVDYFSSRFDEIHIISMRGTPYKYSDNVNLHIVAPRAGRKLNYLFIVGKIKKIIKSIRPDILHSHYATSYGLFGRMSGFHPFIVSVWGSDIYDFPNHGILNKKLLEFILNGSDSICSTSKDMAQETMKYCGKKEIIITPFGVDLEAFCSKVPVLSNDYITIGVAKGLEKVYGIDYLIEAFSLLYKEAGYSNIRLLIVGDGSEKHNLQELTCKLGIESIVKFTGAIDNSLIPDYINKMDVVCIPSFIESFGVAAVEACACGRPLVCSKVGGLKEVVIDGYNGYFVRPGCSNDIKEKIKALIENKEKIKEFSYNARKVAEENFSWMDNARIMEQLYEKLLQGMGEYKYE